MSAREDYELADAAQNARDQQDLDPLLPPEYKNITSADEYATSPSAHGLRLGGDTGRHAVGVLFPIGGGQRHRTHGQVWERAVCRRWQVQSTVASR
jgi:hypothetical protein